MANALRFWLAAITIFLVVSMTWVYAQGTAPAAGGTAPATAPAAPPDTGAAPASGGGGGSFYDIVFGSGIINLMVWIGLFLTSFATLAFIIDAGLVVRRQRLLPEGVVSGVRSALDAGDLGAAMGICEANPGPLSNILMAGFTNITEGYDVVQDAVGAATDLETEKLFQRISYLNVCSQIGPMLGLLGTVVGMVLCFANLASDTSANRDKQLAIAIGTALWTTVCGLLIAIPSTLGFTVYKNLATRLLLESEGTVLDLIKILRNAEVADESAGTEEGE